MEDPHRIDGRGSKAVTLRGLPGPWGQGQVLAHLQRLALLSPCTAVRPAKPTSPFPWHFHVHFRTQAGALSSESLPGVPCHVPRRPAPRCSVRHGCDPVDGAASALPASCTAQASLASYTVSARGGSAADGSAHGRSAADGSAHGRSAAAGSARGGSAADGGLEDE